ncbi:glycosyltransferase family 2 protein [Methylophaga thiooxydans]|uniref:glycosyltransferase family 2 protein n=1 Tax=Methylophaga thiooxydans TaxID=392484 RepID=UPI0023548871|nr:glycosyltransferase [Methylophaga thiooxydans]
MRNLRTQEDIMATWQEDIDKPVVSICCITYNHEPYIEDALEGFLIQQTDFPFEILIHDDASTDATAEIIREYEGAYPKLIKPIYQIENQYSKVKAMNPTFNYPRAKGDFIALCEGDDYWTEKNKLQKQIDYLQSHKDYAMCSHNVRFEFDGVIEKRKNYTAKVIQDADFEAILSNGLFIALNSIVFRKYLFEKPDWLGQLPGGHKALIYILTGKGKNHHFFDEMAVKRRNLGGMTVTQKKARSETYLDRNIFLLENLKVYFEHVHDKVINKKLRKLYFRKALSNMCHCRIISASESLMYIFKLL